MTPLFLGIACGALAALARPGDGVTLVALGPGVLMGDAGDWCPFFTQSAMITLIGIIGGISTRAGASANLS